MKWSAGIQVSFTPETGVRHMSACVVGENAEAAMAGAKEICAIFTAQRECFMRVAPEAHSKKDHYTGEVRHEAFVRMSFLENNGPTHPVEDVFIDVGAKYVPD